MRLAWVLSPLLAVCAVSCEKQPAPQTAAPYQLADWVGPRDVILVVQEMI